MIFHFLDKLLFASLLIAALQVPIFAQHYIQYLTGFKHASQDKVEQYQSLAKEFGFDSVARLIESLKDNDSAVVKADAQNKANDIEQLDEINRALNTLKTGNYFQQAYFMLHPNQLSTSAKVLENFRPGIPLSPIAMFFSLITALGLNLLLCLPFWLSKKTNRKRVPAY